jgi:hypothetical protein
VTITAPGFNYTNPPTITFNGGGGSNAAAVASVSGGSLTKVTITNPGSGYTNAPTVSFAGGGGFGAAGTAIPGNANGGDYLPNYDRVIVLFSSLGGIPNSHITYGGLANVPGVSVWVNGEFDFRVVAHELGHTYGLPHANVWQVTDGNPISGAIGSAAAAVTNGQVTAVSVTSGGSGYTGNPTITFSGGGGIGASATATVASGIVTAINIISGGSGYTNTPTVTLTGGGPTGHSIEYGDPYDTMGGNDPQDTLTDFNPFYKYQLGWITDTQVVTVAKSGLYRINQFDNSTGAGTLALKIPRDSENTYWVAIRRDGLRSSTTINSGAYVFWQNVSGNSLLLDLTTPGNSTNDAALAAGMVFNDKEIDRAIIPLGNGGISPNAYMDVAVDFSGINGTPVWVDFSYTGLGDGSFSNPYNTTANGVANVPVGGDILFKGPASSTETIQISKACSLHAIPGPVSIGQ